MKRYFLSRDLPTDEIHAGRQFGEWHAIYLESHGGIGYAVVLCDEHIDAPPDWTELPHILDSRTTLGDTPLHVLGVAPDHTMMDAALKLAAVHRMFRP